MCCPSHLILRSTFDRRTQSIVSVSEHAASGGKESSVTAAVKEERANASSKSIKTRRRKKVSSLNVSEAGKAKRDPQVLL